jgi:hypothetical protein
MACRLYFAKAYRKRRGRERACACNQCNAQRCKEKREAG